MAHMHALAASGDGAALRAAMDMLGLWDQLSVMQVDATADLSEYESQLQSARETAMATKDFSAVDALKAALLDAGVEVQMSKEGVTLSPKPEFDPSKLEALK
jgi:cysteinyl-tRNA synthetase